MAATWEGGRLLLADEHGAIKTTLSTRQSAGEFHVGDRVSVEATLYAAELELGKARSTFASASPSPLRPATPTSLAHTLGKLALAPLSLQFRSLMLRSARATGKTRVR